MAKVVAIHEIVRPNEIIKPGTTFVSTGEELEQLKAAKAIRYDNSEAEDAAVKEVETQTEQTPVVAKTVAQPAKGGKVSKADKDLV